MPKPETITMSMRELDRCKVIEAIVQDGLMVWRAAEKLGISSPARCWSTSTTRPASSYRAHQVDPPPSLGSDRAFFLVII